MAIAMSDGPTYEQWVDAGRASPDEVRALRARCEKMNLALDDLCATTKSEILDVWPFLTEAPAGIIDLYNQAETLHDLVTPD
jgi:hypothetical protein